MNNYMISVIVRTYNESKHIGELLEKISQQTYHNYEVVVVDSESTDATCEIAKKYNARIIKIHKADFNYSYASNVGVQNARGEIVCFLSGHSVPLKSTYLADINRIFNMDKEIGGCYGDVIALPDGSWVEKTFNNLGYLKNRLKRKKDGIVLEKNIHPGIFSCSNAAAKRDLLLEHPFLEELGKGGEDIEVAYRIIQDGYFIAQDPNLLVMHSHGLGLFPFIHQYKAWKEMYKNVLRCIESK